jgi:uncharacterized membrane protein
MNKPQKIPALLAYLLPILGWLYVLVFHRKDEFAVYHAKQSLVMTITAIGAPLVWAIVAWAIAWIPLVGPIVAAALFALVILTYVVLTATWIVGMVYVSQAKMKPVPVVGGWAERLPVGQAHATRT